ncbi:MAG: DUF4235 domain-containing protein [Gemmatimonadota bacterium]
MKDRALWPLFAAAAAAGAAFTIRQLVQQGWKLSTGERPPDNPAAPDVTWRNALLWGALVGTGAGMARVIGTRGAVTAWRGITGRLPPM